MRIIRASEIGTYQYCQRAWWYERQGYKSENQEELAEGSVIHERHGRSVLTSGCLCTLAYGLLLLALVLASASLVMSLVE